MPLTNLDFLQPASLWAAPNGSSELAWGIVGGLILGFAAVFGLTYLPSTARRWFITAVTFLGGFYYMLLWLWPKPLDYHKGDIPRGTVEAVGGWLQTSQPTFSAIEQCIGTCLLGLGIFSLLRVHIGRMVKRHPDRMFSLVLVVSLLAMLIFGYWDWYMTFSPHVKEFEANPTFVNKANDFLFDGLLINMDACLFSIISFFIFSAAYRAFRIRSVESTILLGTALVMMLSLMGAITAMLDSLVDRLHGHAPAFIVENLKMSAIEGWIQGTLQGPGIRAMEFGLAIGIMAMSLRLWLSIEKGVSH